MGFMQSYKHLDNLCKDMNGSGVTGYIEDMELKRNGAFYVPGWKADYQSLKHYRSVRNKIAHENDADEENMCSATDVVWIDNFYQRVIHQTDPLALYNKMNRPLNVSGPAKEQEPPLHPHTSPSENVHRNIKRPFSRSSIFLLIAALVTISIIVLVAISLYC